MKATVPSEASCLLDRDKATSPRRQEEACRIGKGSERAEGALQVVARSWAWWGWGDLEP